MPADRLDELQALLGAATPGPWQKPSPDLDNGHDIRTPSDPEFVPSVAGNYDYEEGGIIRREDRDMVITLRNAAPDLIAVARAAADYINIGCEHPQMRGGLYRGMCQSLAKLQGGKSDA